MRMTAALVLGACSIVVGSSTTRAQQTATMTVLYTFTGGNDGSSPVLAVSSSDGNFYGTTNPSQITSGPNNHGTIFKLTPTGQLTTIYTFTNGYPVVGLAQDDGGNLYGLTYGDGANKEGTIYKVTPAGSYTTLHNFTSSEVQPDFPSPLVRGLDGNFYGSAGSLFRVTPNGEFTQYPNNDYILRDGRGLILGQNGNFYGVARTVNGNVGTVVQVSPSGNVTAVGPDKASERTRVYVGIIQGRDSSLYGTIDGTEDQYDVGSIFKLALDGTYTRLHTFDAPQPFSTTYNSKLVERGDGNFYGATASGATNDDGTPYNEGTIYQITPSGGYTALYTFRGDENAINSDAGVPSSIALMLGADGNLYGTTFSGGAQRNGTFFKITLRPSFFAGEAALNNGVDYLAFPNGNAFGYYSYLGDQSYIYHFDLGYEYVFDAADGKNGVYFYDFASSTFFYTSPSFPFPYLYDFSLNTVLYYYPDPNNPGRYNTNGTRYFYNFATGQIITK